ncbi:AraC family transcriptional regulator N-terminal domain-containing protein [Deinococcus sp. UYEF24]
MSTSDARINASGPRPPSPPDLERFRELIRLHAPYDAEFPLRVPGVAVARTTRGHETLIHSVQRPALCIVAQGTKSVYVGSEQYEYNPQRMLVYGVNLPIAFQVTRASVNEPFLTFKLDFNPQRIAELALKLYPHGLPRGQDSRGVQIADVNASIVNAAVRLLEAVQDEQEAHWIGPLIIDEILMRLLLSPVGPMVAQLGQAESNTHRVSQATEWIQAHFDEPLDVGGLADLVHMGVSTFHAHFKAVTSMSPLQFQKNLRLQEARRLMVTTVMDAGTLSRQVGYASASQFTREYTRFYGTTPRKDIVQLRRIANSLPVN